MPLVRVAGSPDVIEALVRQTAKDLVPVGEGRTNHATECREDLVIVWGVAVKIDQGHPVVTGLELSGSAAAPVARAVFLHRCEATDRARALMLLANDLEQELAKLTPSVLVVRAMDWFQARRENVARPRLQVEGVLLATARRTVADVEAHSGKEIGDLCGLSKVQVEAEAARLAGGFDRDAAVAALGAIAIATGR